MDGGFVSEVGTSIDSALVVILEQSQDCIKVISCEGDLAFMNTNGRKAMQIDAFDMVSGRPWYSLWPEESQRLIVDSVARARRGERSRFEAFCPTAKGEPRWWDVAVSPVIGPDGEVTHILSTSRDVTEQRARLEEAEHARDAALRDAEIQHIVARETRHRLQNLITVVGSMAKLIARRSNSLPEFTKSFQQQLFHLNQAQTLLTNASGGLGTLAHVIEATLGGVQRDGRLHVDPLPDVSIGDQSVQLLALVLGELRTNAMKHGALSFDGGEVRLTAVRDGETIAVTWREDLGFEAPSPALEGGAGLELIRRMLAITGTTPDFSWTGRGLKVRFGLSVI